MSHWFSIPRGRLRVALLVLTSACFARSDAARAELPYSRLRAIAPLGGQAGTQVEVRLVGEDLDDLTKLHFAHPGLTAAPKLSAPTEFDPEPRPLPGQMVVTIAADVPPGVYDVRAVGRYGVSNPRAFMVSGHAESSKQAPHDTPETAGELAINAAVSGATNATQSDYYRFHATAGQAVRVECWARRLDSRLEPMLSIRDATGKLLANARRLGRDDPVVDFTAPAEGDYFIKLYDLYAGGGEEHFYRLALTSGPQVEFVFPPVATAGATQKFAIYGWQLPGGVPAGEVKLGGVALQQVTRDLAVGDAQQGGSAARLPRLFSARDADVEQADLKLLDLPAPHPLSVAVAAGPVTLEQEPNNEPHYAQKLTPPCDVAGQFYPRGDRDWFTFDAKQGEVLWIELTSQRLGLPTDPAVLVEQVTVDEQGQPQGKEIAFHDDAPAEITLATFDRPSSDPAFEFRAPAEGVYRVSVRDLNGDTRAEPQHAYHLQIRPAAPDFRLLAAGQQVDRADKNKTALWNPSLPAGGVLAMDVLALRRHGLHSEITLTAENLPAGVTATPATLGPGQNQGVLVLAAAEDAAPWSGAIEIVGRATGPAGEIVRRARGATLVWNSDNNTQAKIARQTQQITLAVTADVAPLSVQPAEAKTWEMARGGKLSVPLKIARREGAKGPLTLNLIGGPAEIKAAAVTVAEGAGEATVEFDLDPKLAPGVYSVCLTGAAKTMYRRNPAAAEVAAKDHERIAALAQQRAAESKAANEAKQAAEKQQGETAVAQAAQQQAEAAARAKTVEEERVRREKTAKDLEAAAQPKEIDVSITTPPITLRITAAPITMQPAAERVTAKAGTAADLAVDFTRLYGYAEAFDLDVIAQPAVPGLKVTPVKVNNDQPRASLKFELSPQTPPGEYAVVVRSRLKFHGRDLVVERPLTLVVEPGAEK